MGDPHVAPVAGDGEEAPPAAAAAGIHEALHETLYGILMEWADAQPDAVPWNKWQQEVNKIASLKVPGYRDTFNTPGRNWHVGGCSRHSDTPDYHMGTDTQTVFVTNSDSPASSWYFGFGP